MNRRPTAKALARTPGVAPLPATPTRTAGLGLNLSLPENTGREVVGDAA